MAVLTSTGLSLRMVKIMLRVSPTPMVPKSICPCDFSGLWCITCPPQHFTTTTSTRWPDRHWQLSTTLHYKHVNMMAWRAPTTRHNTSLQTGEHYGKSSTNKCQLGRSEKVLSFGTWILASHFHGATAATQWPLPMVHFFFITALLSPATKMHTK